MRLLHFQFFDAIAKSGKLGGLICSMRRRLLGRPAWQCFGEGVLRWRLLLFYAHHLFCSVIFGSCFDIHLGADPRIGCLEHTVFTAPPTSSCLCFKPSAQLGAPISQSQHDVLRRFENLLDYFLRMPEWRAEDLGRAREKLEVLINQIQELPKCTLGLEDLTEFLQHLHGTFGPYSSNFSNKTAHHSDTTAHHCTASGMTLAAKQNCASAKPVISSRVKWENRLALQPGSFWMIHCCAMLSTTQKC